MVILAVTLAPLPARASGARLDRIGASISRQTPIADSARSVAATRAIEATQSSGAPPGKAVRCALGLTLFPVMGALLGMLVGATGVLASAGSGNSDTIIKGSTVVGAALGIGMGAAVCMK